jgi:hypothetical protein
MHNLGPPSIYVSFSPLVLRQKMTWQLFGHFVTSISLHWSARGSMCPSLSVRAASSSYVHFTQEIVKQKSRLIVSTLHGRQRYPKAGMRPKCAWAEPSMWHMLQPSVHVGRTSTDVRHETLSLVACHGPSVGPGFNQSTMVKGDLLAVYRRPLRWPGVERYPGNEPSS